MVNVPSRNQAPNHKVDNLLSHIIQVYTKEYKPGRNLSSDKQYAIFQVYHEDKHQLAFKHAADGFLMDAVYEDGYTINFYPMNPPPPKKCIEKGYSPTHSQILFMLYSLPDQYHTCGMDNIFILENFLQSAYAETTSKTMVHGFFRKKGDGITIFLYKEIIQREKNLIS